MNKIKTGPYTTLFITAHLLFWIAIYFVPFIMAHQMNDPRGMFRPVLVINHALLIFIFYFNAYFLQTYWYRKTGGMMYAVTLILFLLITINISFLFKGPPPIPQANFHPQHIGTPIPIGPQRIPGGPPAFVLMAVLIGAISVIYRLIIDKIKEERNKKETETENLKTELAFLRSQISPHFIFNALNSTLSLIYKKSDQAADSLLKLSNLMRYMLYESDEEKVLISKEIEYMNDYIELQMLRFGNSIKITKHFVEDTGEFHLIEPMLLIPFIENAFKHGSGMIEHPEIRIQLNTVGSSIVLIVENKYNPESTEVKDKSSGIGLNNVKRRLELLYKGRYELHIDKSENWYKTFLKINLAI